MGVAGCGKTTVGKALAKELGWQFKDADDYHPRKNKEKMRQGSPLDDSDRKPWLEILRDQIDLWQEKNVPTVLACSALKRSYRELLTEKSQTRFIYLKTDRQVLEKRLLSRSHEYMNPDLLDSQLKTLEEPESAFIVDGNCELEEIVSRLTDWLCSCPDES